VVLAIGAIALTVLLQPLSASANQKKRAVYEKMRSFEEAKRRHPNGREPVIKLYGRPIGNNPPLLGQLNLLERYGEQYFNDYPFENEDPPNLPQIQFYKMDVPNTLSSRIEALTHGITVLLPPEYDIHGYELRRYMATIGTPEVFASRKHLKEAIMNTKRAKIVIDYWKKALYKEMAAIEDMIEDPKRDVDGSTRTNFKFAKAKVNAFIVESQSWVKNNQDALELLYASPRGYYYQYPAFNFEDEMLMNEFVKLFRAKQKALGHMHKYPPFREMIY
jgi:hypothetical protein